MKGDAGLSEAERLNQLTEAIIGAAMTVHQELGPGLLESAYEACLAYELGERGITAERQVPIPVTYRQVKLDCGYRLDLLVERAVVVEVKSVQRLEPIHKAQMRSYLRLAGYHVGLLLNFNVCMLKDGISRVVNDFPDSD